MASLACAAAIVVAMAVWMRLVNARQTQELRASEERFRALFEHAIEGVYETPPEGGFRRVNPAMAQILGYASPADVLKIPPAGTAAIYVSPTRRQEFFAALGASDQVANFESEIRRPDGSTVWISENVRAFRDASGRLLHLQGLVTNVTARQQAEAALRASEEHFRILFEHSPVAIVEYDYRSIMVWLESLRAGGVTELDTWFNENPGELEGATKRIVIAGANSAALRLTGVKSVADGLASLPQMFTPGTFAARRRIFLEMWRGGKEVEGEFEFRTPAGTLRRVYYHWWVPIIAGQSFYARAQVALVDLTEIKQTEHALAAERERLGVTLRAMTESVVTTDPAGIVDFMNDAAGQLTGWPAASAIGHPLAEVFVFGAEMAGRTMATPVAAALAANRAIELPPRTLLQPRAGPARRVEGRCAPMHGVDGRTIGVVLVLRDVTERARFDAELLRASKLESIGVLAGGIAHDFNNLLTIVMGNLTIALMIERVEAAGGRWLREAERGTLRAKELTQQLLTFAKGGEPLRSAVRLPEVVREAAEFALHGATVRCEFDLASDLWPADVDKGQIGQVVQNLVINAVQAMPAGGVIRLSLRNDPIAGGDMLPLLPGDYLRLEISDTGKGIAPDDLAHIFEPFFTTKESGTGLGLATVFSVIQKHGGHITVESELGRGTTFRIWVPAAQVEPVLSPASSDSFEPLRGRVLFMDDEEPIRTVTRAVLERLGLEPTLTSDGSEAVRQFAIARISGRPFDLVIMDLTVPGAMGGADAMREILKIDPGARGIVSSGYSSDPVMANYRAHGFCGMIPKPYRISDFARTLREVMNGG